MASTFKTVPDFKNQVKKLLKNSEYEEAADLQLQFTQQSETQKLDFKDQVTLCHWTIKINVGYGQLKTLSKESRTQVNTMINKATNDQNQVEALAELLYLLHIIDIQTQYYDHDRALRQLKPLYEQNQNNFIVTKYLVKALIQADDYQLNSDQKERFLNLKLAEDINRDKLVGVHKHKKETIKIQVKKFCTYRNFMTFKEQQDLSAAMFQSHMGKPQLIPVYRAKAARFSELNDYKAAKQWIENAEKLVTKHLNPRHFESLLCKILGTDLLLRDKNLALTKTQQSIETMESALQLALGIYGQSSIITSQTKLKLAMVYCLEASSKDKGLDLFKEVEQSYKQMAEEMESPESHDLLFNLLFEFQMTLHDFNQQMNSNALSMQSLQQEAINAKHNVLQKQCLLAIQKCYSTDSDPKEVIQLLDEQIIKLDDPVNHMSHQNFYKLEIESTKMNFQAQVNLDEAHTLAKQTLTDAKAYYGHEENVYAIDARLIVLQYEFASILNPPNLITQQQVVQLEQGFMLELKACQELIKLVFGVASEKLSVPLHMASIMEIRQGNLQKGLSLQSEATKIIENIYGQISAQFVQRLHDEIQIKLQVAMMQGSRNDSQKVYQDVEKAAQLSRQVFQDSPAMMVSVLNTQLECLFEQKKLDEAQEILFEIISVYRGTLNDEQQKSDKLLSQYLFKMCSILLMQGQRNVTIIEAYDECLKISTTINFQEVLQALSTIKSQVENIQKEIDEQKKKLTEEQLAKLKKIEDEKKDKEKPVAQEQKKQNKTPDGNVESQSSPWWILGVGGLLVAAVITLKVINRNKQD